MGRSAAVVAVLGVAIQQVFLKWNQGQDLRQAIITIAVTVAGHVLNELLPKRGRDPGPARDLALKLARRSGTLVILEPAQRPFPDNA